MRPPATSALHIVTGLLRGPPLMLADQLGAWVRALCGPSLVATWPAPRADDSAPGEDDRDVPPWEIPIYTVASGLAHVRVSGPLVKGYDAMTCWWFGMMSQDRLQAAIAELAGRADVSAVLFDFNSPGGMVQGTPESAAAIARLGESKLTLAYTDALCCSAAYWLASQCSLVAASPSATVGSIGTYLAFYDYTEYLAKEGIKLELFVRGTHKAAGLPGNPLTAEQRALFEARTEKINQQFLATIRTARPGVSDESMQGQTFDGAEALAAGLIDHVVASRADLLGTLLTHAAPR